MKLNNQLHAPTVLHPGERDPDTHWTGSWVGLDNILSLPGIEFRPIAIPTGIGVRFKSGLDTDNSDGFLVKIHGLVP